MEFFWTTERTTPEIVAAAAFWAFFVAKTLPLFRRSARSAPLVLAAFARICFASVLALLFLDPTFVRTVAEKAPLTIVLDDSASAARPLDAAARDETVWTRTVATARVAEEAARRRGRPIVWRTLSGRTFASLDELPKTARFEKSPLRDVAQIVRNSASASAAPGDSRRILLLSDGVENGRENNATEKNGKNGRESAVVDAAVLGAARPALDWRWENVAASTVVYPGEDASFSGELRLENAEKNATRRAVVRRWERAQNAAASPPKLVEERVVDVETDENGSGRIRVERSWTPRRDGVFDYFVLATDFEDAAHFASFDSRKFDAFENFEFCLFNNVAAFSVAPRDRKLAVLLIDDEPRYEYRYLRELLRREETISLKTLLFSADAETRSADETAFSLDEFDRRTLAKFDVVVVGDVPPERWNGRFERLVDVVLAPDATTSVWFLGGERTSTPEFWRTAPAPRLAPNGTRDAEATSETTWRWAPTPRGRNVFSAFATFFDSLENDAPLELSRIFPIVATGPGDDVLLAARSESGREIPLFVVASPGKNSILRQATDELWRLRTRGDKTLYRRFVLRALEFLTNAAERGDAVSASSCVESKSAPAFDSSAENSFFKEFEKNRAKLAVETADVAARSDVLREIATATGGETLDLRDFSETASRDAAAAFFARRFDVVPNVSVEKRSRFISKNVAFPLALLFFCAAWSLEFCAESAKKTSKNR